MDKNVNTIITSIVFLLALDLWGVHAKLLYQLNPDKIGDIAQTFSYVSFNENTITSMLFALVFAFVPVLVLTTISPKVEQYWLFVIIFAFFDGGAWFIYYNKTAITHFATFGAIYYGLFIVFVVSSVGFIRMRLEELTNEKKDETDNNTIDLIDPVKYSEKLITEIKKIDESLDEKPIENKCSVVNDEEIKIDTSKKDPESLLIELYHKNTPQKEIAEHIGWHPSKVCRTLKKYKENGQF